MNCMCAASGVGQLAARHPCTAGSCRDSSCPVWQLCNPTTRLTTVAQHGQHHIKQLADAVRACQADLGMLFRALHAKPKHSPRDLAKPSSVASNNRSRYLNLSERIKACVAYLQVPQSWGWGTYQDHLRLGQADFEPAVITKHL